MNPIRSFLSITLSALLIVPAGLAQQPIAETATKMNLDQPQVPSAAGNRWLRPYRQPTLPPVNLANSNRLEALIRGGNLYLSLDDAIALALENNLDIELSRYTPQLAQVDLLRAKSGGLLRGVPTAVRAAASGVQAQVTGGATGGGGQGAQAVQGGAGGGEGGGVGGAVITQTGTAVPIYDPQLFFSATTAHRSSPQSNTITTGTTALAFDSKIWSMGYQQNFATGTQVSYGWNNTHFASNNRNSVINPGYNPNMQLQISQRLLQGFGLAVNTRNIRVAKNNVRVGDLTFKLQVMTTVAGVVNLYWDLVSFNEDLKVKRKALEVAQKFYEDNKKQVEIGTLAPIEIVRAEARVAQAQQELTNSETSLLQQETILKNALSKTGVASPTVSAARIIPTDRLVMPDSDPVGKLEDLTEVAMSSRPDLEQTRINLENNKIAVIGSRNQLLPSLDVQATFQNNALAGQVNSLLPPAVANQPGIVDAFFLGGYGKALGQIFRRNFPDYSIGFQLNIPIRNRTAQADFVRDQISLRQAELSAQRQINDVRVNVANALTAVLQARARYAAAVKERQLQEQTLDAENKKYALGASTAFQVVQTQRDLAQAQGSEVAALAAYSRARVQLDLQTAQVLERYKVEIAEAMSGKSSRPITPLPPGAE
jgi:outer membrane protein TolC